MHRRCHFRQPVKQSYIPIELKGLDLNKATYSPEAKGREMSENVEVS
jgi:hypothetical protein